ncbi:MAG: O-antigen ligase family protein [Thermomicrobiales bacterium]
MVAAMSVLLVCGGVLTLSPPLPVVLACLVAGMCAALASPSAAAAGVAVALPLVQRPVAIGGAKVTLLEIALLTGGAAIAARLLLSVRQAAWRSTVSALLRPNSVTACAGLLLLVAGLSLRTVADSRHSAESLRSLRTVMVEPCIALALARWVLIRRTQRIFVAALIATGMATALWGMVNLLSEGGAVVADGVARARGPYSHPNNLALYLDRVGLFATGVLLADPPRRRWLWFAPTLLLAGVGATLSRGAGAGVLAGGAWLVFTVKPKHGWRWLGAAAGGALAAFGVFAATRLTASGGAGGESSRRLIWTASLRMVRDHPIFGVGLDQFLAQYGRRYVSPAGWQERYTSHPHNIVLDVWLSLGLPGLLAAILLAAAVLCSARTTSSSTPSLRPLRIGAAAALIGGLVHGTVDNGFFLPDLATLTWVFIAMVGHEPELPPAQKATGDG